MIERASPVQLRKSLEIANLFVKAGIRFVPMPCADDPEYNRRMAECIARLDEQERAAADPSAPVSSGVVGEVTKP